MSQSDIIFSLPAAERKLVTKIAKRVAAKAKELGERFDRLSCEMDLIAVHNHDMKLDFARLLDADDFNLFHDVFGIERHLDRETGKLGGHFLPRFRLKANPIVTGSEVGAA